MSPRALILAAALTCLAARAPAAPSDFATAVLAYNGTNGVSGYDTPAVALGPPSTAATPDVPDNSSVVSFGWGGYLTLGFDQTLTDDPRHPGGYDFIVFGNAFYQGGDTSAPYREPGYVEVGVDPSGRHQYGDGSTVQWYWLKGIPAPVPGFPQPMPLPATGDTVIGYADCTPTDGSGDPLIPSDPTVPGVMKGSAGGDAFDLKWAVDASGAPVHLASADFVRIRCAVQGSKAPFGVLSTEVDAVSLVRPRIPGDVDMDGFVTIADVALTVRAVTGLAALTDEQTLRADVTDHDGPPTLGDAERVLRTAGGLGTAG